MWEMTKIGERKIEFIMLVIGVIRLTTVVDCLDRDEYPQYLYLSGELIMPMPDGTFLYFPKEGFYKYLSKDELYWKLQHAQKNGSSMYKAGMMQIKKRKS